MEAENYFPSNGTEGMEFIGWSVKPTDADRLGGM